MDIKLKLMRLILSLTIIALAMHITPTASQTTSTTTALITALTVPMSYGSPFTLNFSSSPSQTVPMKLDIASPTTTVECGPGAAYDPSKSSSFRRLRCRRSRPSGSRYANCTVQDSISLQVHKTDYRDPDTWVIVPEISFKCVEPNGNKSNVAGFGVGSGSLVAQVAKNAPKNAKIEPGQFALCLPSFVVFGNPSSYYETWFGTIAGGGAAAVGKLMKVKGEGYSLVVRSVTVNDTVANILSPLSLKVSTVEQSTKLESSAYKALTESLKKAIGYGSRVKAVPAVAPYDTCFNATTVMSGFNRYGPLYDLPTIDLHLGKKSNRNVWSIKYDRWTVQPNGAGSGIFCLRVVDAGSGSPSVLGTDLQQHNLLHFNLTRPSLRIQPLVYPAGCIGLLP